MVGVDLLCQKHQEALPELERKRVGVGQLEDAIQELDESGPPIWLLLLPLATSLASPLQKLPLDQLPKPIDGSALGKQQYLGQSHQLRPPHFAISKNGHVHRVAYHLIHQDGGLLEDESDLLVPFGAVELAHPLEGVVAVGRQPVDVGEGLPEAVEGLEVEGASGQAAGGAYALVLDLDGDYLLERPCLPHPVLLTGVHSSWPRPPQSHLFLSVVVDAAQHHQPLLCVCFRQVGHGDSLNGKKGTNF